MYNAPRTPFTRTFSVAATNPPSRTLLPAQVYISTSLSPYLNLAYEDWLFRHTPNAAPLLFLYRNRPSVIIGRNQNPWKETSPPYLRQEKIPLVRRRSGGGTVYHDEGNTNFSIMLPPAYFSRPANARLILSAVHEFGVPEATLNERNDVYVGPYKISMTQRRSYHHGTMLLTTSMNSLRHALKPSGDSPLSSRKIIASRGVESVRSPVGNLTDLTGRGGAARDSAHERFVLAARNAFGRQWGESETQTMGENEMQAHGVVVQGIKELQMWEWTYGQTPLFEVEISLNSHGMAVSAKVEVYHGVIKSAKVQLSGSGQQDSEYDPTALERMVVGKRWGSLEPGEPEVQNDIIRSLRDLEYKLL